MSRTSWSRTCRAGLRHLLLVLWACSLGACESETEAIHIESVLLATGEYYGLAWGGTQVERFHVLAHSGTRNGDVVIISPQNPEPCSLGKLAGYMPLQPANGSKYVIGSPSPARIGLFGSPDEDGRGVLGFSDVDCKRTALEVPDVLPNSVRHLDSLDLMQITIALPTKDRELLYVDPWAGTQKLVANEVTGVRPHEDGVWLIEHGALVKRDHEGHELARFGSGVRELLPMGKTLDIAYIEERGLYLHQEGKVEKLERDACKLRSLGGFLPKAMGYFSPCEARTLQVRKQDGDTFAFEPAVGSVFVLSGHLLFTSKADGVTSLWMALPGAPEKPKLLFTRADLAIDNLWLLPGGRLLIADKQDDDTLTLLLANVTEEKQKPSVFDEGVVGLSMYEDGVVVVHDDGTLTLLDRYSFRVMKRARGVLRSGFRFLFGERAAALAYVERVDAATKLGTLQVQFLTGEEFTIAREVREFREVWWPERGVLYAKGGQDAGVYFARIDVPCELVSDSPWACGF